MKTLFTLSATALCLSAVPVLAQDAAAGERTFNQCQTCHVIANPEGEVLAGRAAKTGPNLYGLPGRTAGTEEEFASGRPGYKDSIVAAGEAGLVWDEEHFVQYVQDPNAFLKEYLDDSSARSGMAFKVRSEEDARDLWAFISSLSPEPES